MNATVTRYSPLRELVTMNDRLNRMFSDFYGEAFGRTGWMPAVDICESSAS